MIGRIIAAAFQFRFIALAIYVINRCGPSNEMRHRLQPNKTKVRNAVLALYIAAKDVLAALHYQQDEALQF